MLLGTRTLHIKQPLEISSATVALDQILLLGILTLVFFLLLLLRSKIEEV